MSDKTKVLRARARETFFADLPRELPVVPDVSCDGCGACCMHMGFPPFFAMYEGEHEAKSDPEWLALKAKHPELAAEARQGAVDNRGTQELPCIWLDPVTKRCLHYEHRPHVCREFELGSEACLEHRKKRGIGP